MQYRLVVGKKQDIVKFSDLSFAYHARNLLWKQNVGPVFIQYYLQGAWYEVPYYQSYHTA